MKRKENWPSILAEAIDSKMQEDFSFGTHDCCIFTCDIINAITGVDMARDLRGYKTPAEVVSITREYGYEISKVADTFAKKYKLSKIENIQMAHKGDVALVRQNDADLLGVVCQGGKIACAGDKGVVFLPLKHAICAWRIPY